jgi:integrase
MIATEGTKERSEPGSTIQIEEIGSRPRQLGFDGDAFAGCVPRTRRARTLPPREHRDDPLLQTFRRRCARVHTTATAKKYAWCASNVIRLASERLRDDITLLELFREPLLLGSVLVESKRAGGGTEVSGWTVANRRTAMRSVAGLMAPELTAAGIEDPVAVVDDALRACAERVGTRYRLPKAPVRDRGGRAATPTEVRSVSNAMRSKPGWAGQRDAILVEILFVTGARVNATLALEGASLTTGADGRGVMQVCAKHRRDSGEFLVPADLMSHIDGYVSEFNAWSRARGLPVRIGVGAPGPLWRSPTGRPFEYGSFVARLTVACQQADVERLTPHAFRRAFATTATEALDRRTVSRAGGWLNTRLMDAHYVQRPAEVAKRKVARATRRASDGTAPDATTPPKDQPAEIRAR